MKETPPHADPLLSHTSYPAFAAALSGSGCRNCALSEQRTRIVVDRGDPKARIMVVGEAPGKTEDQTGKAFVGRAGKVFDKAMASVGLDTDRDMLICNIAKCRPPGNRPPTAEEAAACLPYLRKQIDLIRPGIILLLGATALRRLDPSKRTFSMSEETGRIFRLEEYPGTVFMVLYHPAALLYNSKLRPVMLEHAQKLKGLLENDFKFTGTEGAHP